MVAVQKMLYRSVRALPVLLSVRVVKTTNFCAAQSFKSGFPHSFVGKNKYEIIGNVLNNIIFFEVRIKYGKGLLKALCNAKCFCNHASGLVFLSMLSIVDLPEYPESETSFNSKTTFSFVFRFSSRGASPLSSSSSEYPSLNKPVGRYA